MPRIPLLLGRQSGEAASVAVSTERLVNGYYEQSPQGREPTPIYGTPGLTQFGTVVSVRAMLEMKERLFVVSDQLYEVFSDGSATGLGSVPGGTVDMAGDGTNVVLTVGGAIYVYDGATLAEVTDEDAPAASSVEYMNGFFVFTEVGTEQFFISPQGDPGGDFQALDFDSSDISPDNLIRTRRVGRTLLMFGRQSVEFWFYSGDAVFPFNRYQDDPLDVGLAGVRSEASTNETVFWLANDKTVRRLDGRTATRISTFAIENRISSWEDVSATVASSHVYNGHLFVVFRNPDGCVVWDQATGLWHERQSYESDSWRAIYSANVFGTTVFGGGKLYKYGGYVEDSAIHPFEMITPWIDNEGQRFSITGIEVRVEAGTGDLEESAKITLSRTEDGETWTTPVEREYGKLGERFRRVSFARQGQSRGCAFKLRITDPFKRVIYAAYAEVS